MAVDGGLSDNPRPLLYGASYTAVLANRAAEAHRGRYSVTGRHCEEDVMIRDLLLPEPRRGDVLSVPAAGAYTLAMASNYKSSLGLRPCSSPVGGRV